MAQNARIIRRLLALGCVALLLGAILPNVLYIGHMSIPGVAAQHEHSFSPQEVRDHTAHCHFGPAGCSDHSHPSTSSWSLPEDPKLVTLDTANTMSIVWDAVDVPEGFLSPPEKPPQIL